MSTDALDEHGEGPRSHQRLRRRDGESSSPAAASPPRCTSAAHPEAILLMERLRDEVRRSRFDSLRRIGGLLLEDLYCGSEVAWRSSKGRGGDALHELAQSRSCPLSRDALADAIDVYILTCQHSSILALEHISVGHVIAVLPCRQDERLGWLSTASDQGWSVSELRAQVRRSQCAFRSPETFGAT